jgi:hypothetical protein
MPVAAVWPFNFRADRRKGRRFGNSADVRLRRRTLNSGGRGDPQRNPNQAGQNFVGNHNDLTSGEEHLRPESQACFRRFFREFVSPTRAGALLI